MSDTLIWQMLSAVGGRLITALGALFLLLSTNHRTNTDRKSAVEVAESKLRTDLMSDRESLRKDLLDEQERRDTATEKLETRINRLYEERLEMRDKVADLRSEHVSLKADYAALKADYAKMMLEHALLVEELSDWRDAVRQEPDGGRQIVKRVAEKQAIRKRPGL